MSRGPWTGIVTCDAPRCKSATVGSDEQLIVAGWDVVATPSKTFHLCDRHPQRTVQISGHPEKESTMTDTTRPEPANAVTTVTTQQTRAYLKVRDQIVSILQHQMYLDGSPLTDHERFNVSDFDDVAMEIMSKFTLTLIEDEKPF